MTVTIKILGPGCRNCQTLHKLVVDSLAELGLEAEVSKVEDYADIAAYGVMSTPGLVVNEEVVSSGKVPTASAVKELLAQALA